MDFESEDFKQTCWIQGDEFLLYGTYLFNIEYEAQVFHVLKLKDDFIVYGLLDSKNMEKYFPEYEFNVTYNYEIYYFWLGSSAVDASEHALNVHCLIEEMLDRYEVLL